MWFTSRCNISGRRGMGGGRGKGTKSLDKKKKKRELGGSRDFRREKIEGKKGESRRGS